MCLTNYLPVPYKYSEITTGAVPRYHTGSNFFYDTTVVVFSFLFLDMVPCAWYPTIWYQAYGTMYQQGTYFRSYVCTYIFSFIRMYVCMDVRTYENTKKNFGIYVTGKYRKVWYHIKKTVTTLFVRY